ncbi:MAG TPA: AbrB/MazE/SpoVT family DNA-binding domain-containing protein [Amaricoccus sp.]|uniref:AbrB/MazE/SpoVT family DNA-binding domain-containing protein n=1 Tax=Amaricoccus sp. TaxID=1872485 RepID=UPI002D18E4CC|nr:AbrB/MazE/SpoVT family DNA-binding domain-containing protein [Amaricoccus sp.]HMU01472.1 AbrB/MazE/SpoVT family DNA-binding domain-containing protein [Amaricoccus sp.]
MHLVSLRAVGGSVMVTIPKTLLDVLGLQPNTKVGMSVDHGRLIIEPRAKPRYALADLVAQCQPDAPASAEDQEWLDAPPVGDEAL